MILSFNLFSLLRYICAREMPLDQLSLPSLRGR